MKDLVNEFKLIFKKDKKLLWWMFGDFALAVVLFLLSATHLGSGATKEIVRYSDITSYESRERQYILSFAVMALTLGVAHLFLGVKLHAKRGRDTARLFFGVTMMMLVTATVFLWKIVGER